jgi:hypothetical protein
MAAIIAEPLHLSRNATIIPSFVDIQCPFDTLMRPHHHPGAGPLMLPPRCPGAASSHFSPGGGGMTLCVLIITETQPRWRTRHPGKGETGNRSRAWPGPGCRRAYREVFTACPCLRAPHPPIRLHVPGSCVSGVIRNTYNHLIRYPGTGRYHPDVIQVCTVSEMRNHTLATVAG